MPSTDPKETLSRLRAIRGGHRGTVTRLEKAVEELINDENATDLNRLQVIDRQLEGKLSTLDNLDRDVQAICELESLAEEIEESDLITERILRCRERVRSFNQQASSAGSEATPSPTTTGSTTVKPRLPKLTLPKFKGDVTKWSSFWDSFETAIHSNSSISTIDKFNYLNSLLEGNAARSIQGLTLTSSNYNDAVELLQERFGKPQIIISAHMDEILKIQSCTDGRIGSLRSVYDNLSVHVRGLAALGVSSEQYGSLLIPIIMSKLPSEVQLQIARKSTNEVWKIDELLHTIKAEIDARESSEGAKSSGNENPHKPVNNRSYTPPSANALLSGSSEEFKIRCAFCGSFHYSASCDKVLDYESRKKILANDNRCFNCLRKGHQSKICRNDRNCRHCNKRHHQSICEKVHTKVHMSMTEDCIANNETTITTTSTTTTTTEVNVKQPRTVLLQTARAVAIDESGKYEMPVRILFDTGSQRSYITENLQSKLKLKPVQRERLKLNTFGETRFKSQGCDLVRLQLKRIGSSSDETISISALTFPVICSPLSSRVKIDFPHLEGLELADDFKGPQDPIDVLVGSDFYWDIVTGETVSGHGPTAVSSKLGWLLSGPTKDVNPDNSTISNLIISGESPFVNETREKDEVTEMLRRFWDTESIGINDTMPECQQPIKSENEFDISHNGRIYEVGLPWKDDCLPSSDNRQMCESRIKFLHRKLSKEPALLNEYHSIMQEQERSDIIERTDETGGDDNSIKGVHYSPHHAIVRKDRETTKVRVVYDGSAKSSKEELSLNDCLEIGPNFIPHIFDMLTKFRWNSVGLTADIEKAFLNVGIKEEHRDMLRFLWFEDPYADKLKTVPFRFNRLVFGLRPSPSILGATIKHHLRLLKQDEPDIAQMLEESFYVDDLVTGEESDEGAFDIYHKSKGLMAKGGFNLRKWRSNSKTLLQEIAKSEVSNKPACDKLSSDDITVEDDESYTKSSTGLSYFTTDGDQMVKVLGIKWNTDTDEFYFSFEELYNYGKSLPVNKRSVLMITAKIFDPLGITSPLVIRLKMFFQVLCTEKLDWDEPLQGEMLKTWNSMFEEFKSLEEIRIPRCYFSQGSSITDVTDIQLHAFSDASEKAYAAVLYLRTTYGDGQVQTILVTSKTRVSPIKKQSIPRLELLGATILARLVSTVVNTLPQKVNRVVYWVDSRTVLCWIRNEKPWKQYVRHRVDEIRRLTSKEDWRHCPGNVNPADLPSRGLTANEMSNSLVWWNGPSFLCLPEEQWPPDQSAIEPNVTALSELTKNPTEVTHVLAAPEGNPASINLAEIIKCEEFGTRNKLLRVTAYVLRFIYNVRLKVEKRKQDEIRNKQLSADEINEAETYWIRTIQASSFAHEINYLQKSGQSKPRRVDQFALFLDETRVLRCRGRINNSTLPINDKNPILLPSSHPFLELIIRHTHEHVKHSAVNNTLTTLREKFWILKGRQAVKRVLKRCVTCRKLEGLPYSSHNSPDLPSIRVSDDPPFTHTGVDFAGPLYIRPDQFHKKENEKCYICLFTCASTRAVHLEITRSLTVESFLLAFRRFASRRGLPATLISDNAKNFKGSSKEIQKIARSIEVMRYLSTNGVTWKFIVERAPWWGGFWERLIQSVKRCLKKCIGRTTLNYDELHTLLIEVESVVNSRPLTYVEDDQDGVSYTLCPSHLINGRRITSTPNGGHFEVVSTNASLTRRTKHHIHLLQQFTSQWRKSYLLNLRENHAQNSRIRRGPEIAVGDVVILKNDSTNRMFWKLAKVEELLPGRDGLARAAIVKVANSDQRPRLMRRSVKHLYPIEVNANDHDEDYEEASREDANIPVACTNPNTRPRRNAAIMADILRKIQS